jgi:anti-sigma regulatory factor (Ser/Thr protein kinase)
MLLVDESFSIALSPDVEEDKVWRHLVRPLLRGLSSNVMSICEYGMNEMINNAIDHSEGTQLEIRVVQSAANIEFVVKDDGIGIFNKIKRELQLGEPREAILELSKGKLTTDPDRHTGEGIFFVSRMFDKFVVVSGSLYYSANDLGDEGLYPTATSDSGTTVTMSISTLSKRNLREVFDLYASEDFDYTFSRTDVPVALARFGSENLVSRSQARRLLTRLDEFKSIALDFGGIESIGQPFADEIFRVYARFNPEVEIMSINANEAVERMIRRARSALG